MAQYFFDSDVDIKLIILYMMNRFPGSVTNIEITDIVTENGYAEYFPIAQCFTELCDAELVESVTYDNATRFSVTEKGKAALAGFADRIPFSVREKLLSSIKEYLRAKKADRAIVATYTRLNELEYQVTCAIQELGADLFRVQLTVPSKEDAQAAVKRFRENPEAIYSQLYQLILS